MGHNAYFKINTTQHWWARKLSVARGTVALATPYHVGLVLAVYFVLLLDKSKGEPAIICSFKKYKTRSYSTQADECERGTIRT